MITYTGALCNDPEYIADHLTSLDARLREVEAAIEHLIRLTSPPAPPDS